MSTNNVPDTYNGKPTKYELFDGFLQSNLLVKILYFVIFPLVPIIVEISQAASAKENAKLAAASMSYNNQGGGNNGYGYSAGESQQNSRFRDTVTQDRGGRTL